MTRKGVWVQGVLAGLGLLLAWVTWQREPGPEDGHTVVLDLTRGDLEKVRYEDGDSFVELSPGRDALGDMVWVRLSGKKGPGGPLPAGHPVVQADVPERVVRGSESARTLFKLFAPLYASRALGALDEERSKALGLDSAKRKLIVSARGRTHRFTLAQPPAGAVEPYLRDDEDGRVYLVSAQILSDFKAAQANLVERRYHPFLLQETDALVVKDPTGSVRKRFAVRRFADGRPGAQLVPEGSEAADETATTWHDRIFGLFPAEVLGKDEPPSELPPQPVVRLEYLYRGRALGWLELARTGDAGAETGASSAGTATPRQAAIARSEFTGGWTRLSLEAQPLLGEAETLFGLAPAQQGSPQ